MRVILPQDAIILGIAAATVAGVQFARGLSPAWDVLASFGTWYVPYVVAHFVLFCNVVRVPRWQEIAWSIVFGVNALAHMVAHPVLPLTEPLLWQLLPTAMIVAPKALRGQWHSNGIVRRGWGDYRKN